MPIFYRGEFRVKLLKVNATVAFAVALSLRRIMWYNLV